MTTDEAWCVFESTPGPTLSLVRAAVQIVERALGELDAHRNEIAFLVTCRLQAQGRDPELTNRIVGAVLTIASDQREARRRLLQHVVVASAAVAADTPPTIQSEP